MKKKGGKKGEVVLCQERVACSLTGLSSTLVLEEEEKKSKGSKILLTRTCSSSSSSNAAAPGRQARIKSMSSQNVTHVIHLEEDKMSTNLSDERKKETEKEEKDDG